MLMRTRVLGRYSRSIHGVLAIYPTQSWCRVYMVHIAEQTHGFVDLIWNPFLRFRKTCQDLPEYLSTLARPSRLAPGVPQSFSQ